MVLVSAPARSRRDLLAGAAGGVLALVAAAIGRPLAVRAADGDAVVVGGEYTATTVTKITNRTPRDGSLPVDMSSGGALRGDSSSGIAIHGVSDSYAGVWGESTSLIGVRGVSASGDGVAGSSGSGAGVFGFSAGSTSAAVGVGGQSAVIGVLGTTGAGVAVRGDAVSGFGLYGRADSGTGLYGSSSTGHALRTSGRLRFDRASGSATVAAGTKSVIVKPGFDLPRTTKVLVTLQGSAGGLTTVHRVTVNPTAGTFTVYLTADARRAVHVAWLVLG
jgi:hypothetical protein